MPMDIYNNVVKAWEGQLEGGGGQWEKGRGIFEQ